LEDNLSQLAIRSKPFSDNGVITHEVLTDSIQGLDDKSKVWTVSNIVLQYLNNQIRAQMKQQAQVTPTTSSSSDTSDTSLSSSPPNTSATTPPTSMDED
jgi:hypothetical protein